MTTARLLPAQSLKPDTHAFAAQRPAELSADPLLGQQRAIAAIQQMLKVPGRYAHSYMTTAPGARARDILGALLTDDSLVTHYFDWIYVANPNSATQPLSINVPAGSAAQVIDLLVNLLLADIGDRADIEQKLKTTYATPALLRYLTLIMDKQLDDLPGNELASIVVSHDQPQPFLLLERVTEATLFGRIRLQSEQGTIHSELHLIEAGALLKANGGVLVIDANELLRQDGLWQRLKHVLKTSEFVWPQPGDSNIAAHYEPEPIPVKLKVILLGERDIYAQLREIDADFDNLFPYLADLAGHYSLHQHTVTDYFHYLYYVWQEAAVMPLGEDAFPVLFTFAARMSDYQHELSLDTIAIMQLLREAHAIASNEQATEISGQHLRQVLVQRKHRNGYMAELSRRAILEDQVHIATQGEAIGQLNGLTVVTTGGAEFGEPSRITATVHYGDGDIIDIERKSELSGNIHTKGVMILTAYIANLFARNEPMSLSATIVFEQSYHEVDGDSASLAELCCLISALADTPLKQGLAITGAVDQFGRVQAIGAVNEKTEGYFDICKTRGLTGEQGVIIPVANLSQLNLDDDVVIAVTNKEFQVYAVEHVTEALELLTGLSKEDLFDRIRVRLHQLQPHARDEPFWRRWFD